MANIYHSDLDAFSIYHQTQESHSSHSSTNNPLLPALGHALAGSTGTAIANLAIYPLDLVTTRLQIQRTLRNTSSTIASSDEYAGVLDAFKQIYEKEGGIKAFYQGVVQSTTKSIADAFLFFLFYNFLRERRLKSSSNGEGSKTTLPALDELAVGMLAGACSKAFTTPISNVVTRKQTSSLVASRSSPSSSPAQTVSEMASQIHAEKGLQGFWSGYSASLVLTLNPSITFFLYETFKRVLLPRAKRDDPGAKITFLMAAVAKSVASAVTYPFSLEKARAQTSSRKLVDVDEVKEEVDKMGEGFQHIKSDGADASERDMKELGREAQSVTRRVTVFGAVWEIYKNEGLEGLYEGVWGEILKGFFGHGGTMLVKEMVHKVIIQAYFLILKALNQYPSPKAMVDGARDMAENAMESGKGVLDGGFERVGVVGDNATSELAKGTVERGKDAWHIGAERAGVMSSNAAEVAQNAVQGGKGALQVGAERASFMGSNASGVVQSGIENAIPESVNAAREGVINAVGSVRNAVVGSGSGEES